jgi:hypothetical protein
MYIENKKELAKLQSLIERMDKHYTASQAEELLNDKLNETCNELDARNRTDLDINDFFDMISTMKGGARASFGYVSVVDLNIPTMEIINPKTKRKNNVKDWKTFSSQLGEENEISGVIKFGMYTLNWRSPESMTRHYNNNYVTPVNTLRDKYGVSHIKKKEHNPIQKTDYGISIYQGDNEELKQNSYSQQDMKTPNTKKEIHYYLIGADGSIMREASVEELKPYFKQKGVDGIKAFKELVKNGSKTEEEMLQMFKEYGEEIKKINFDYRTFVHTSMVYVITSIKGEKKRFFNKRLTDAINGLNINPQEFINLAKKFYKVADEQTKTEDLGVFSDDE